MFNCFQLTPRRQNNKTKLNENKIKNQNKKRTNQVAPAIKSNTTSTTILHQHSRNAKPTTPPITKPLYNVRNSLNSNRFKPANQQNNQNKKKPLQKLPRNNRNSRSTNAASSTRSAQDLYGRRFSSEYRQQIGKGAEPKRVKSCGAQPAEIGHPTPLTSLHRMTPKYVLPKRYPNTPSSTNNSIPTPSSLIENLAKTQNTTPQVVRKINGSNNRWSTSNMLVNIPKKSNSKVNVTQKTHNLSKTNLNNFNKNALTKTPLSIARPETSPAKSSRFESFSSYNRNENSSRYDTPNRFENSTRFDSPNRFENSVQLQISGTKQTSRPITRAGPMTAIEQLRQLDTSSPTLGFSNRRYQRLEKAVQSKLLERLNTVPAENNQPNNLKSDDSMRSVIQEVIQKHVELSGGDIKIGRSSENLGDKMNDKLGESKKTSKSRLKNRVVVSRQQGKRQSLNSLMQDQNNKLTMEHRQKLGLESEKLNDTNLEIIGESDGIKYSPYTQKLLQETPRTVCDDTPRLEINQIFDGTNKKYDIHKYDNYKYENYKQEDQNNNTKTIYTTQNYRIIQKSDGSYAYKLPNKPCEEFKSYKNRDAKDIARYVKKLKKRLTTAAAKGSVMSLSKHESDLRLSKKNTPRNKEETPRMKLSFKNSCLNVEDTVENVTLDQSENVKTPKKSSAKHDSKHDFKKDSKHNSINNTKNDSKSGSKNGSKTNIKQDSKNVKQDSKNIKHDSKNIKHDLKNIKQDSKNTKQDSKIEYKIEYKSGSRNDSRNDLKGSGFKGKTLLKPSQISQKIKEDLNQHSRTNVQLNLLMNKTMKWVMTQDFEGNAKEDAQKLN